MEQSARPDEPAGHLVRVHRASLILQFIEGEINADGKKMGAPRGGGAQFQFPLPAGLRTVTLARITASADCLETRVESWSVILLSARGVAVDVSLGDTGRNKRIALKVENLGAVSFRNAHVADKRGEKGTPQTVVFGASRSALAFCGFHITNPITFSPLRKRWGSG